MHEVTTFQYQSHQFRSLFIENEPWFVAKDVCDVLGIGNVTMALEKIPEQHLALNSIEGKRGRYEVNTISEPGLYRLILRSNKPEAEPFIEWVTSEVLPQIRKTGSYALDDRADKVVDIRHFRNTPSPSGLDIRYSLDLTRVVMKPTALSLAIAQRLTGVDLGDVIEALGYFESGNRGRVELFVQDCCIIEEGSRSRAADLYDAYCTWQHEWDGAEPMSKKAFGGCLSVRFGRFKSNGLIYYANLLLNGRAA